MPASPTESLLQSPRIESTHDHPLAAVADMPEHPQPGTIPIPPIPGVPERSATLESLFEALNRASMPDNTTLNATSFPSTLAATTRSQDPPSHRHVRPVILDPVIEGPHAPMTVLPPSTPGNHRQQRLSIASRILMFFGYGRNNRARKELVSVIWALMVDFSQVRHISLICPLHAILMQRVVSFLTTDYRDHHALDHLDAQQEPDYT